MVSPSTLSGGEDRLSTLPDGVLEHILGFLPAEEAVRTCVLAQSWRNLWKFTRRLLMTIDLRPPAPVRVEVVRRFVNRLLFFRLLRLASAPLDACEIKLMDFDDEDVPLVNTWITRVVKCHVRELQLWLGRRADHFVEETWFQISDRHLTSPYLTSLDLNGIEVTERFVDFSSCPALEDLSVTNCNFTCVRKMKSPSLKRLDFSYCECSEDSSRLRISVPSLVWLRIENPCNNRTPMLERMPNLVVADVEIGGLSYADCCSCDDLMGCHHVMGAETDGNGSQKTMNSVILGGLSEAKDLTLMAHYTMYLFRRDLRWCPTFYKLKTLLLDDYWCVPADCSALISLLEHAPVLEKLTILFAQFPPKYNGAMEEHLHPTRRTSTLSKHLKIVRVVYLDGELHDGVTNALKFLGTLNFYRSCEEEKAPSEEGYTTIVLKLQSCEEEKTSGEEEKASGEKEKL